MHVGSSVSTTTEVWRSVCALVSGNDKLDARFRKENALLEYRDCKGKATIRPRILQQQ